MFKKIFSLIFFIIFLTGCAAQYSISNSYTYYYNEYQVDSICNIEKIPSVNEYEKWISIHFLDEETNLSIKQSTYIRNIKENKKKSIEEAFICSDLDTIYKFQKRILIKEKK